MTYEITIKKKFRFENQENGNVKIVYALSAKDYPNITVPGKWIYLKDSQENLERLSDGVKIKGELYKSTFVIQQEGYQEPPLPQSPPPEYNQYQQPQYQQPQPQPQYQQPQQQRQPQVVQGQSFTKNKMLERIQEIKDAVEELRLLMVDIGL